jgi:hypothetical protein
MKGYRNPSLIQKVFQKIVNRYKSKKFNNRNPLGWVLWKEWFSKSSKIGLIMIYRPMYEIMLTSMAPKMFHYFVIVKV